jgi:DNA-binding XRE family transcriptional regulator
MLAKMFSEDANARIKFISNLSHDVTENVMYYDLEIEALKNALKYEKAKLLEMRRDTFVKESNTVKAVYMKNVEQGTKLHRILISKYGYNEDNSEISKSNEIDKYKEYFVENYSIFRKAVGITSTTMMNELGISTATLNNIERGISPKTSQYFIPYFRLVLANSKALGNFDLLILSYRDQKLFENIVLTNKNKFNVREALSEQKIAMLDKEECIDYDGKIPKFLMDVLFNA